MYPRYHAETSPDKAAAISAHTGEVVTYAELDARSNRLAQPSDPRQVRPALARAPSGGTRAASGPSSAGRRGRMR